MWFSFFFSFSFLSNLKGTYLGSFVFDLNVSIVGEWVRNSLLIEPIDDSVVSKSFYAVQMLYVPLIRCLESKVGNYFFFRNFSYNHFYTEYNYLNFRIRHIETLSTEGLCKNIQNLFILQSSIVQKSGIHTTMVPKNFSTYHMDYETFQKIFLQMSKLNKTSNVSFLVNLVL